MKKYLIYYNDELEEGVYKRNDTYYTQVVIRNPLSPNDEVDPGTAVRITITDPCGTIITDSQDMTKDSTGTYSYNYAIPSNAPYGQWTVSISAITDNYTAKEDMDFFILPWNAIQGVRRRSGIGNNKTISDHDLADEIWAAFKQAVEDIYSFHDNEKIGCCGRCGTCRNCSNSSNINSIDGTNTTFRLKYCNMADHDGDGEVSGVSDSTACDGDVYGYWLDEDCVKQDLWITVTDAVTSQVELMQTDGSAIPTTNKGVYVSYWTKWGTWKEFSFREAVEWLAAFKVTRRFTETDRATLVDIEKNKQIFLTDPDRCWDEYRRVMENITEPLCDGVSNDY